MYHPRTLVMLPAILPESDLQAANGGIEGLLSGRSYFRPSDR